MPNKYPHSLVEPFKMICKCVEFKVAPFRRASSVKARKLALDVLAKVSELKDTEWAKLPYEAQVWFDKAAELVNAGGDPLHLIYVETPEAQTAAPGDPVPVGEAISTPLPIKAEPETVAVTSKEGVKSQAPVVSKGKPGGGNRLNPAMAWARRYVLAHPEVSVPNLMLIMEEQNFVHMPAKGSLDATVYEMRQALLMLAEMGYSIERAAKKEGVGHD